MYFLNFDFHGECDCMRGGRGNLPQVSFLRLLSTLVFLFGDYISLLPGTW